MPVLQLDRVRVYTPDSALHGSEIPVQLTWPRELGRAVAQLRFSSPLGVVETHNAHSAEISSDARFLTADSDEPGYLGFILLTGQIEATSALVDIEISLKFGDTFFEDHRSIRLFRPRLMLEQTFDNAVLESQKTARVALRAPIGFDNVGEGTAIAVVRVLNDAGESVLVEPAADARAAFVQDIRSRLPGLAEALPRHSEMILGLSRIFSQPLDLENAEQVDEIDRFMEEFQASVMGDQEFETSLQQVFSWALSRNFTLSEFLNEFVNYLSGLGEGRVIIANALDRLRVGPGRSSFRVFVNTFDLAGNSYPEHEVGTIRLEAAQEVEVAAYQLFQHRPRPRAGGIPIG